MVEKPVVYGLEQYSPGRLFWAKIFSELGRFRIPPVEEDPIPALPRRIFGWKRPIRKFLKGRLIVLDSSCRNGPDSGRKTPIEIVYYYKRNANDKTARQDRVWGPRLRLRPNSVITSNTIRNDFDGIGFIPEKVLHWNFRINLGTSPKFPRKL